MHAVVNTEQTDNTLLRSEVCEQPVIFALSVNVTAEKHRSLERTTHSAQKVPGSSLSSNEYITTMFIQSCCHDPCLALSRAQTTGVF